MKYTLTLLSLGLLLTGCGQSDSALNRRIVGTWTNQSMDGKQNSLTVSSDGSFVLTGPRPDHSTTISGGTWQISDAVYVMTFTNVTSTGPLPHVGQIAHFKVLHLDDHTLTYYDEESQLTNSYSR